MSRHRHHTPPEHLRGTHLHMQGSNVSTIKKAALQILFNYGGSSYFVRNCMMVSTKRSSRTATKHCLELLLNEQMRAGSLKGSGLTAGDGLAGAGVLGHNVGAAGCTAGRVRLVIRATHLQRCRHLTLCTLPEGSWGVWASTSAAGQMVDSLSHAPKLNAE